MKGLPRGKEQNSHVVVFLLTDNPARQDFQVGLEKQIKSVRHCVAVLLCR